MTKSKTLVDMLEALKVAYTIPARSRVSALSDIAFNSAVEYCIDIACTHQDAELQRLRDVIGKCRDLLKQYPCATDGMNSSECRACDIIAECDKVLRIS